MNAASIRARLGPLLHLASDEIRWPHPTDPNLRYSISVSDLATLTEAAEFSAVDSGYAPHLNAWHAAGLITEAQRAFGKGGP